MLRGLIHEAEALTATPRGLIHEALTATPRGLIHEAEALTATPRGLIHEAEALTATPRGLIHEAEALTATLRPNAKFSSYKINTKFYLLNLKAKCLPIVFILHSLALILRAT